MPRHSAVNGTHKMLKIRDEFALNFNVKFNSTKSVAIRVGYGYSTLCSSFTLREKVLNMCHPLNILHFILWYILC